MAHSIAAVKSSLSPTAGGKVPDIRRKRLSQAIHALLRPAPAPTPASAPAFAATASRAPAFAAPAPTSSASLRRARSDLPLRRVVTDPTADRGRAVDDMVGSVRQRSGTVGAAAAYGYPSVGRPPARSAPPADFIPASELRHWGSVGAAPACSQPYIYLSELQAPLLWDGPRTLHGPHHICGTAPSSRSHSPTPPIPPHARARAPRNVFRWQGPCARLVLCSFRKSVP